MHTGDINREPLPHIIFECQQSVGPFKDVKHFHDWFATLNHPGPNAFLSPFRSGLLDEIPIVFTPSDLNRSNIMMHRDADGNPRITGIID
jgi:glutamate mutase epsilon subunit